MISVVLPTRGLVFTQTEIALEENLRGIEHKIYRSFNLPIPECQNVLVEQALCDSPSHILFVEEDIVIPKGGVKRMIQKYAPIAFIDYGVAGWSCRAMKRDNLNDILWCGLGCTLVRKDVFDVLEKPYFRTDKALRLNDWTWIDVPKERQYGGQDIYFFMKARDKGLRPIQVSGECEHLVLENIGQKEINNGLHKIGIKPKISKLNVV